MEGRRRWYRAAGWSLPKFKVFKRPPRPAATPPQEENLASAKVELKQ